MRWILIFATLGITSCGGTPPQFSSEKIKNIASSRPLNDYAIVLNPIGYEKVDNEFDLNGLNYNLSDSVNLCKYFVEVDQEAKLAYAGAGLNYKCREAADSGSPFAAAYVKLKKMVFFSNMLTILPALEEGKPISSIGVLTIEWEEKKGQESGKAKYIDFVPFEVVEAKTTALDINPPKPINPDFDFILSLVKDAPSKPYKGEFETTAEFEKRLDDFKKIPRKSLIVHINKDVSYDADNGYFSILHFGDQDTVSLQDDTKLVAKSGTNGFGTGWNWINKTGDEYILKWNNNLFDLAKFYLPGALAKLHGPNLTALVELDIPSQNWQHNKNYVQPEFGNQLSSDYYTNYVEGSIKSIYLIDKTNNNVLAVLR